MAVRVKLKIKSKTTNKTIQGIALLNSGYESAFPEITIPQALAEKLSILENIPDSAEEVEFETAGGPIKMLFIKDEIEANVICNDKETESITLAVAISKVEHEILLSDSAIEAFGIEIISAHSGKWRFRGEHILRVSELPQRW